MPQLIREPIDNLTADGVTRYGAPAGALRSTDCRLFVNGVEAVVHHSDAGAYACVAFEGPAEIELHSVVPLEDAVISPRSLGLGYELRRGAMRFTLDAPRHLYVSVRHAPPVLLFFDRPIEPDRGATYFFEAGRYHDVGVLEPKAGESIFIEGGAVVRGGVLARRAHGLTIDGHGTLEGSPFHPVVRRTNLIKLQACEGVRIRHVLLTQPTSWMIHLWGCRDTLVEGVKEIGEVMTSDGVDVVSSHDTTVRGCFLRNNDDCVAVKAMPKPYGGDPGVTLDDPGVSNLLVERCVMVNDHGGNAMEIGHELRCDEVKGVAFRDIDVVRADGFGGVFTIHNADHAHVHDVRYEDVRVEHFFDRLIDFWVYRSKWSGGDARGRVGDVTLRGVRTPSDLFGTPSFCCGFDADHRVERVTVEDFCVGPVHATDADRLNVFTRHADDVVFADAGRGPGPTPRFDHDNSRSARG